MKRTISLVMLVVTLMISGAAVEAQNTKSRAKTRTTQVQTKQPEWIYGTWSCSGTMDYGPYFGGRQRFTAKLIISKTNLKVYYNGELDYNGSYVIKNNVIRYNQKNGTADILPLDSSNKRIEFGDGMYYSKTSSNTY